MHYFDIYPQVIPADSTAEIRIHPRYKHAAFPVGKPWKIKVFTTPMESVAPDGIMDDYVWGEPDGEIPEWYLDDNGDLIVKAFFMGEQEHCIVAEITREDNPDYCLRKNFKLYSLKEDLYSLRPWKGETHSHTTGSDGREEPAYTAARYRQKGYDFVTISDHRVYEPSLEAIDAWKSIVPDFQILAGEEVHAPGNPVHIVNCGGKSSVNDLYRKDEAAYMAEVNRIAEQLDPSLPEKVRFVTASCRWVFDRIREADGVAVYCHPYWKMHRSILPQPIIDAIFADRKFDAVELLGGFYREEFEANNFQIIRCFEEWTSRGKFPVLAASDSHGTEIFPVNRDEVAMYNGYDYTEAADKDLFGWYSTIVFAPDNSRESLLDSIRKGNCAALETLPGTAPHIYGELRLVRYISFLLRAYFPIHNHLCMEQAEAMLDYLGGEKEAAERLVLLQGRVRKRMEEFFSGK